MISLVAHRTDTILPTKITYSWFTVEKKHNIMQNYVAKVS